MSNAKKGLLIVVLAFIILQFIPIDKTNPPVDENLNFVNMYSTPDDIKTMLKNSCYDCHSNETVYPWYSKIAPFSFMIKNHINEAREHLNFSEFGNYNTDQKEHVLEEASEEVLENKMPMSSYTIAHSEAKLSPEERQKLADYFDQIAQTIKGKSGSSPSANSSNISSDDDENDDEENEKHDDDEDQRVYID